MEKHLTDLSSIHQVLHLVPGFLKLPQIIVLILFEKRIQVTSMDSGFSNSDGESIQIDARSTGLNPEETIIQGQRIDHMRLLVSKLKPKYRELVEKRYFEEMSYEEIAEEMNLPLGTVKAQLFRARDFLSSMLDKTKETI